jgi:hypothetical protein
MPSHWPAFSNLAIVVNGGEMLILKILLPLSLRQQQLGIFERTRQSRLHLCRLCVDVIGSDLAHLLKTGTKYSFVPEYFSGFLDFQP